MTRRPRPKLLWNARLDRAVAYAGKVHKRHKRKGTTIPYIAHLLDVASVALKHSATEDEVVAALLHDTLEDGADPQKIRREIRRGFGSAVLRIVDACTDTTESPKPDWLTRKKRYVAGITKKTPAEKFVSACDKVANVTDMIEGHRLQGAKMWDRFSADSDRVLWYYRACARGFAKGQQSEKLARVVELLGSRVRKLARLNPTQS